MQEILRFQGPFRKRVLHPEVLEQAPQGMVTAPSLAELKKHLDNALWHKGIVGVSCAGPAAGEDDPDGSLPTEDIL